MGDGKTFEDYRNLCAVHHEWDEDCETCMTAVEACRKIHATLESNVQYLMTELNTEGADVHPAFVSMLRFDTFLDMFLGAKDRAAYEHEVSKRMSDQLKRVVKEARRAKLTHGIDMFGTKSPNNNQGK